MVIDKNINTKNIYPQKVLENDDKSSKFQMANNIRNLDRSILFEKIGLKKPSDVSENMQRSQGGSRIIKK